MRKINYKSDFDAALRLRDCKDPDKFVPWPDCDFDAVFWTSNKARCHTASRSGGTYTNCFATGDGGMHFVFKGQRMGMGTLKWEPHFALPNGIYPDGIQDVYRRADLGITLVDGEGDCPTTADVEVLVPYIKFKYGDLTDAEKAELGKPATDAAASVAELERSVETAEAGRVANEKSRVAAETTRQTDEATRQSNEAEREEAEAEREENEAERMSAETARAEEFATWEDEIDSKADRSELSNIIAEEPLAPDNFPDINTYTREELKKDLFVDMWNSACGKYGKYAPDEAPDADHPFYLNELWLTYEEAMRVWLYRALWPYVPDYYRAYIPTNLPLANGNGDNHIYGQIGTISGNPLNNSGIVVWNIGGDVNYPRRFQDTLNLESWNPLRKIIGVFTIELKHSPSCWGSSTIEDFRWKGINISMHLFSYAPNLTLESVRFAVNYASNTAPITITVHPDVYAKLTDEANAEWHQVLLDAAEKDITFATT